jgi:hypothetical protein
VEHKPTKDPCDDKGNEYDQKRREEHVVLLLAPEVSLMIAVAGLRIRSLAQLGGRLLRGRRGHAPILA